MAQYAELEWKETLEEVGDGKEDAMANTPEKNDCGAIECIVLDDDDEERESPAAVIGECGDNNNQKEQKSLTAVGCAYNKIASSEQRKMNHDIVITKLGSYISSALDKDIIPNRKLLDTMLGAIRAGSICSPSLIRRLIHNGELLFPISISIPPSQVVDMLIEHKAEASFSELATGLGGKKHIKSTEKSSSDRHSSSNHAPHMTKFLMGIGQSLVRGAFYSDFAHVRNMTAFPGDSTKCEEMTEEARHVWETLREQNAPLQLQQHTCELCPFKSESRIVMAIHRQIPHLRGRKYQCAICLKQFLDKAGAVQHYPIQHNLIAGEEETIPRNPCPCCGEEFMYKRQCRQHLKLCCDNSDRNRTMAPDLAMDVCAVNKWLWEKPPADPILLQHFMDSRERRKDVASLSCNRCERRFLTGKGLERHWAMTHALGTSTAPSKVQIRTSAGRCTPCLKTNSDGINCACELCSMQGGSNIQPHRNVDVIKLSTRHRPPTRPFGDRPSTSKVGREHMWVQERAATESDDDVIILENDESAVDDDVIILDDH